MLGLHQRLPTLFVVALGLLPVLLFRAASGFLHHHHYHHHRYHQHHQTQLHHRRDGAGPSPPKGPDAGRGGRCWLGRRQGEPVVLRLYARAAAEEEHGLVGGQVVNPSSSSATSASGVVEGGDVGRSSSGYVHSRHRYSDAEVAVIEKVIRERRDMRHFRPNATVPEGLIERLVAAANHAPSVGYMQPWRFIRVADRENRMALCRNVDAEREATAHALPTRAAEFLRLKVEGIREAAEVLVVALMPDRSPHIFGRRTMPSMDLASVSCAIQNMWLLARAEGIGLGWVSIFDPDALSEQLHLPQGAVPVAILCIGPVADDFFPPVPLLETSGWNDRLSVADVLFQETWREGARGTPVRY